MVLITSITPPVEGLVYTADNLKLKIGEKIVGNGTLYITQSCLSWAPDDKPEGISIMWKQISVHGISSSPQKCIYFMLDHQLVWNGVYDGLANGRNGNDEVAEEGQPMQQHDVVDDSDEDEGNATDEEDEMTEFWLIPSDINIVDVMFQAMTECQALHPDSAESISEESDFMDDEDADEGLDNGAGPVGPEAIIERLIEPNAAADADAQGGMENLNINDERFADADE